jgi:hypothetical protein
MMQKLVFIVTVTTLLVWSGVAWLAYTLIRLGGQAVASNADVLPADPEFVELASWIAVFGTGVGEWIIIIVWAAVAAVPAVILALGFVAKWILPGILKNRGAP